MQVGRYDILEIIGQGTSGRVARAHDPLINRIVAVKLLSPEFAHGAARDQFIREARVVGQLTHPAIIALHDMGVEESSATPYLVMEYVEGQPLDTIIAKGSIPYPKACAWVGDVALALSAAHRKGVIHGDVKPANILITDEGRVKLTDFGISRLQNHDAHGAPLLGTPSYWCPEQLLGKPQNARSDIFSLGVVLYEMVTGQRPFDGNSLQAVCGQILSATPLAASQSNPSIPTTLDAVVERCLAKDPIARFATGEELAANLWPFARRKLKDHAITAVPVETIQRRRLRIF